MRGDPMIRNELLLGTVGISENSETYKIISEMADKISNVMNKFFLDNIFERYLEITKEKLDAIVYVNSEDFCKLLMCPLAQAPSTSSMFEAHAINSFSYKKCIVSLPTVTLVFICFHIYCGEPTCDIKEVFKK